MGQKFINFVYWLEDNKGVFPRHDAKKDSERRMYSYWKTGKEVKEVEDKYSTITSFDGVPKIYHSYLKMYFNHRREKSVFKRMLSWLDSHNGKKPQSYNKMKDRVRLGVEVLTDDQREERALYARWNSSEDRKIIESYKGKDIKDVPLMFRDYISRMRAYGYGIDPLPVYPKLLEWLEKHNVEPRKSIRDTKGVLSEDEKNEEIELRKQWDKSEEKKIFLKYASVDISLIPEEYREMVKVLKGYGLDNADKDVYTEIVNWLEKNKRLPRGEIRGIKKAKLRAELTEEEKYEVRLRAAWNASEIKDILENNVGVEEDLLPEEYKEKIMVLRGFGLGIPKLRVKNTTEEYISWLSEYGKRPRTAINKGNNVFKVRKEMTDLEAYEISLAQRFQRSEIRNVLNEYYGKDISLVPEEFRKDIARLRSLGEVGKSKDMLLERRMKTAVSRQVKNNQKVREELNFEKERSFDDD